MEATAEASVAAIRERRRFGMAIAAITRMMSTTMSSSINENPFCFARIWSPPDQAQAVLGPCRTNSESHAKTVSEYSNREGHSKARGRCHMTSSYQSYEHPIFPV